VTGYRLGAVGQSEVEVREVGQSVWQLTHSAAAHGCCVAKVCRFG